MSAAWDTIRDLHSCLCAQFETDGPPLCFCGIVPGSEVALEYQGDCEDACGMAWIKVGAIYPSKVLGAVATDPNNCAMATGIDLELGVMRCLPVGDSDGSPPSQEELQESTEQMVKDMMSVRSALLCCSGTEFIMGTMNPFGPAGGTVGFTVEVNFMVFS
jgi:hypothetical protein